MILHGFLRLYKPLKDAFMWFSMIIQTSYTDDHTNLYIWFYMALYDYTDLYKWFYMVFYYYTDLYTWLYMAFYDHTDF